MLLHINLLSQLALFLVPRLLITLVEILQLCDVISQSLALLLLIVVLRAQICDLQTLVLALSHHFLHFLFRLPPLAFHLILELFVFLIQSELFLVFKFYN